MKTVAVLPVKRFCDSLMRLSDRLGVGARSAFAQTMFRDVLVALRRADTVTEIAVVTGDREARDLAMEHQLWVVDDPADAGHSKAVLPVLDQCVARGFDQALLVPIDCPLLDPAELDRFLRETATQEVNVVVVPDRHGAGTNALLLRPPTAMPPSFGEGSLRRHIDNAEARGLDCTVEELESLAFDIDTEDDLMHLASELEGVRGRAQLTTGAVRQLFRTASEQGFRTAVPNAA